MGGGRHGVEKVVGGKKEKDVLERRVENESGDHPMARDHQSTHINLDIESQPVIVYRILGCFLPISLAFLLEAAHTDLDSLIS
jgi:hypothetical protein